MKKSIIAVSLAVASLTAASNYNVGIAGGRGYVSDSPMGNHNFLDVRMGKYFSHNHILSLQLEKSEKLSGKEVNGDRLTRAILNFQHYYNLNDTKLKPYVFAGGGYQWVSGSYENGVVADLGIGARYPLTDNLSVFSEFRGLRDFKNNDNHINVLFGVAYRFGKSVEAEKTKIQPVEKTFVKPKSRPKDDDKDGIPNKIDKCPNTPKGVKVDKNGCPIDSDKDGVPNYLDKCPNTPKGTKVNKFGCPVAFNFEINFDTNSAKIKPVYMNRIKEFAKFLKENPKVNAVIEGFTDNRGSKAHNLKLSEARAKAVYEALIKLGVSKDRLSWKGFGEENPTASNDTKSGRAKNRRVIAKIIY
jgi:OOP family OmpA-OmpF porin